MEQKIMFCRTFYHITEVNNVLCQNLILIFRIKIRIDKNYTERRKNIPIIRCEIIVL